MLAPAADTLVFCAGLMGLALPLAMPEEFGALARPAMWAASIALSGSALSRAVRVARDREWLARAMMTGLWAYARRRSRRRAAPHATLRQAEETPSMRLNF